MAKRILNKIFLLVFLSCTTKFTAQYKFSGEVNAEFSNATVYLNLVNNYKKSDLFLIEEIIQECEADKNGKFEFEGELLANKNRIYKIYIDNCKEPVTNYKHLLNHCEDTRSVLFIASNTDTIHFPLNSLSQVLCSYEYTNPVNIAINSIDAYREDLLFELQTAKSDLQRKNIYKKHCTELKKMSRTFDEPLAELYAYNLYANENSFSRAYYLEDLKTTNYYNKLLRRLEKEYYETHYAVDFMQDLIRDQYPLLKTKNHYKFWVLLLSSLLFFSLIINIIQWQNKRTKKTVIDYRECLTTQEQKILELMQQKLSNKEIANKLFISLSTVKTHINNIYSKLSISSRNEIYRFFE